MSKELINIATLRHEYGLGRDLATRFARLLPHIKTGRSGRGERLLVRRADFERLISRAATERVDLWQLARQSTPESLQTWMNSAQELN